MEWQPFIAVRSVKAISKWYCKLLGAENFGGGSDHDEIYDRILFNGYVVRPSFVPPAPVEQLRMLTRPRKQLVREAAQHT